jgi:D-beta-D-heptose 7-phosphate kinase/D-beta-D-heptose 1-phosphate adenosyltransferase
MYILITGGFDPLHSGHIKAFEQCSRIGKLTVGLNSDEWLTKKKGTFVLPFKERQAIVLNCRWVDSVLDPFDDSDGTSVNAISAFSKRYNRSQGLVLFFANGGDRTPLNASKQEIDVCNSLGVLTLYGIGGTKSESSSNLMLNYNQRLKLNALQ